MDELGRIREMTQAGWKIRYKRYQFSEVFGVDLPGKLYAEHDEWKIKLIAREWQHAVFSD